MISSASLRSIPRVLSPEPAPSEWFAVTLRCCDEIMAAVSQVMAAMSSKPYTVSDGIAVQHSATRVLQAAFENQQGDRSHGVQLRYSVSPQHVSIEVETPDAQVVQADSARCRPELETQERKVPRLKSVLHSQLEVRDAGRVVAFSRQRGQRVSFSGPPLGYDYQI